MSHGEREAWAAQGIRAAFVVPLRPPGEQGSGLVLIAFRRPRLLPWYARRRVESAAVSGWLALCSQERAEENGRMRERERVAREVHDSLVQYIGAASAELGVAELAALEGDVDAALHHMRLARQRVRLAADEGRRVVHEMRPGDLDRSTLPEALRVHARRVAEESGIEVDVQIAGQVRNLGSRCEHALLRVGQEALNNARKHSGAARAKVFLSYEPHRVVLVVSDDGGGLKGPSNPRSRSEGTRFGMRSMRERAVGIGGLLRVENQPGRGTAVSVEVPLEDGL